MRKMIATLAVGTVMAGVSAMAQTAAPATSTKPAPMLKPQQDAVELARDPVRQLGRGLSNVTTGVLEIPFNMISVGKESGDVGGATYGLFRGIERFFIREFVGVFEIVTFPVGWAPIIEPEFPFEPVKTTEWKTNGLEFRQQ